MAGVQYLLTNLCQQGGFIYTFASETTSHSLFHLLHCALMNVLSQIHKPIMPDSMDNCCENGGEIFNGRYSYALTL